MAEQLKTVGIKLKEKESFTDAIIDNISSGLLTVDMNDNITYYNKSAELITGKPYNEIYNRKIKDVFPEFSSFLKQKHDSSFRPEITYDKEGKKLFLGAVSSKLKDHEEATKGKIIIFQDLTKLKQMEEDIRISDRLAAVGKLAAGIAHEIRNPLASMSGSIQLLQKHISMSEEDQKLMGIVLKETERLNVLITEFLTFVRPSKLKKKKVMIKNFIDEIVSAIQVNPDFQKDIKISSSGKDINFYIDTEKCKQILWNLLINASQAMPHGGEITISWHQNEDTSTLEIKDTGNGIPEKIKESIFDPFFTTKEGGTGLGLATVYKIVESHRGHIHVTSEETLGTTFAIEFPN